MTLLMKWTVQVVLVGAALAGCYLVPVLFAQSPYNDTTIPEVKAVKPSDAQQRIAEELSYCQDTLMQMERTAGAQPTIANVVIKSKHGSIVTIDLDANPGLLEFGNIIKTSK